MAVLNPCIVYMGQRLYRLDDGPLVLVGKQQHRMLQYFLDKQYADGRYLLTGEQRNAFYTDEELHQFLRRTNRLRVSVRMTTEDFREQFDIWPKVMNLSAIMKSLKRGPLGLGIDLPGHAQKGRGYFVRIKGIPDLCR